jgi:sensor histidine kinase YesM
MAEMTALVLPARRAPLAALRDGLRFSWPVLFLIILVNTGVAAVYWIEDPRPFWHPFVSVQCYGLCIAYCVNVAQPWASSKPLLRLAVAVAIGAVAGILLTILLKGYDFAHVVEYQKTFALNLGAAFLNGLFVSLFFLLKHREKRAAEALHEAEAQRHVLEKQAMENELKLLQAQVEPHFLFNTLASVQYLTETNPPEAAKLLGHLLGYLRAALPQIRSARSTLGQEIDLVTEYLSILRMRIGDRLNFIIDVPQELRAHPFPPVLLMSVVENAVTHGIEPLPQGGAIRIEANRQNDGLVVSVIDTGAGLKAPASRPGHGVGLTNVRERLAALFGNAGRFKLEDAQPRGTRATIEIPFAGRAT